MCSRRSIVLSTISFSYLISHRPGDAASSYFEKVKTWLRGNYIQIQIQEEYTDLWDLVACITKFKQIVTNERGNLPYINVSTGTKVTAIAGTIVSMLTGCTPYYAKVNYGLQQPAVPPTEIVEKPFEIPVYRITRPDARSVKLLEFINQSEGSISKKELVEKLCKGGIIRSAESSSSSPSFPVTGSGAPQKCTVTDWGGLPARAVWRKKRNFPRRPTLW